MDENTDAWQHLKSKLPTELTDKFEDEKILEVMGGMVDAKRTVSALTTLAAMAQLGTACADEETKRAISLMAKVLADSVTDAESASALIVTMLEQQTLILKVLGCVVEDAGRPGLQERLDSLGREEKLAYERALTLTAWESFAGVRMSDAESMAEVVSELKDSL